MGNSQCKMTESNNNNNNSFNNNNNSINNNNNSSNKVTKDPSLNIYYYGDEYIDLTPFQPSEIQFNNGLAIKKHPFQSLEWKYFLFQGFHSTQDVISTVLEELKSQYNNVIVCAIDFQNGHNDPRFEALLRQLSKIEENERPSVIFVFKEKPALTPCEFMKEKKIVYNDQLVHLLQHDINELTYKLTELYSYYNQLGDEFFLKGELYQLTKPVSLSNLNILAIGPPGAGKSTFINKFLGAQRSLVRKGTTTTTSIIKYHHPKYPFIIFDTPGIEDSQHQQKVTKLLKEHHRETFQKNYDYIHLILYLVPQGELFFKTQDIPFLKELLQYNVPLVFLINHCCNRFQGRDAELTLKNILDSESIKGCPIRQMNMAQNIRGYQYCFQALHSIFEDKKINEKELFALLQNKELNTVINEKLKTQFFFKNITDTSKLLNRINNQVNDLIRGFTKSLFVSHLTMKDLSKKENARSDLIQDIGVCFGIYISPQEAAKLLLQWDINTLINNIKEEDINNLETDKALLAYIQTIPSYEQMDIETFRLVYSQASPHLTRYFFHWLSKVSGYKKYAIANAMLGYKCKLYCQGKTDLKCITEVIIKGIESYNKAIDSFITLSNDESFKDTPIKKNNNGYID